MDWRNRGEYIVCTNEVLKYNNSLLKGKYVKWITGPSLGLWGNWRGIEEVFDFRWWAGRISSMSQTLQERGRCYEVEVTWDEAQNMQAAGASLVTSLVPAPLWFSLDSIISQTTSSLSQTSPHRLGQHFQKSQWGIALGQVSETLNLRLSWCLWVRYRNETKHTYMENSPRLHGQAAAVLDSKSLLSTLGAPGLGEMSRTESFCSRSSWSSMRATRQ